MQESKLPKLFESWQPVGMLTAEAAQTLGLPADVVVCAGAGDNAAAAVGCGAVGGSSSSNNIGPLDLINLRRVAWGSEKPEPQPETPDQPEPDSALIARLTEEILKKLR